MGLPVYGQDEAQSEEEEGGELDWYQLYCQAIAAGVKPDEFGDYTYTEIHAAIDGHKLARYNDMYFNVADIVSNMSDDNIHKALHGGGGGDPRRGKLIEKMMRPYSPSFLLPEIAEVNKAKPIEGLNPKTAEGIMQAVENRVVPHSHWLSIHPIWQRLLTTAKKYGR